jgi:cytochrome b pre-mRNA-processing protein 3
MLREHRHRKETAARLYDAVVAQARQPGFYRAFGVPDTMLGRYEMVCLHAFLVLKRLKGGGPQGRALAQTLHDLIFDDFDIALREAGLGDMGVGKRLKKLARNLHGRISAYERGLVEGEAAISEALRRNLYASAAPTDAQLAAMVTYLRDARRAVDALPVSGLFEAELAFPEPDEEAGAMRTGVGG